MKSWPWLCCHTWAGVEPEAQSTSSDTNPQNTSWDYPSLNYPTVGHQNQPLTELRSQQWQGRKGECGENLEWRPEPEPSHSAGDAVERMHEGNNLNCGAEFQHKDPWSLLAMMWWPQVSTPPWCKWGIREKASKSGVRVGFVWKQGMCHFYSVYLDITRDWKG